MHQIVAKRELAPAITRFEVEAPRIARKWQAGQFVILRLSEGGERIPLTIADVDRERGLITLIVQRVGKTTTDLSNLEVGAAIRDLTGPLGTPTHIENFGTVGAIAGGVGTAVVYPIARALKEAGNRVWTILGARSRELVILAEELQVVSDELAITTEDGSLGYRGLVTDLLREWLEQGRPLDHVFAAGPVPMMQAVVEVMRPYHIPTTVSLNPIMVDGTGMCGCCRVSIHGQTKYTCVEGPEFDGFAVNFEELMARLRMYRPQERLALERCQAGKGGGRSRLK
ncbi:MAG TPA: sulfide/dihydroorotate dehydrogenase-like FAD/NAD-binding protein [Armatimonadetes bacterium]|nr:sulfide/dihydroorotate dehydrogenase-like FAD/NAD-binding protein [Armatimonadota bacterium]